MKKAKRYQKKNVSKDRWLAKALETLESNGVEGVKIERLAKALKKAVNIRLVFLRAIFADLGFDGDELEMRTRLFVCYHSWENTMFADVSRQKHLHKLRYKLFIKN